MRSASSLLHACLLVGAATAATVNLESAATERCPRGYVHFAGTNRCYSLRREGKTHYEAREECENEDAKLVSIHSKAENDFVATMGPSAYIGLKSKSSDELNYGWIDGTETDFTAWADDEPSDYKDLYLENCVVLFGRYDSLWIPGMWNNIPCRERHPFICKAPAVELREDDAGNVTLRCKDEIYKLFQETSSCYKLYNDNTKMAAEAARQCLDDGGQLTAIHTKKENGFLAEMAKSIEAAVFIGLHSETKDEKNFKWTDGTKLDYTSWAPKEPSKTKEPILENCVALYGHWEDKKWHHKWNNVPCTEKSLPFVCSRKSFIVNDARTNLFWIMTLIAAAVVLLVVALCAWMFIKERRRLRAEARERQSCRMMIPLLYSTRTAQILDSDALYAEIKELRVTNFDARFLIPHSQIGCVDCILGAGNFGVVYRSKHRKNRLDDKEVDVACKQLHSLDDEAKKTEFLVEASIMMSLRHTHVVVLHGVAFNEDKIPILVMELLAGGSLYDFLRNNEITEAERLRYGKEIACGMLYLHSCNLIHRDLATRNCMLTEDRLLKIADFGLARAFRNEYAFQHERRLPWRWTAPEDCFQQRATTKSDVWSFGVTLWEVFTQADIPYKEVDDPQALFTALKNDFRLQKPANCSDDLFTSLMCRCWAAKPEDRPDFGDIFVEISKRYERSVKDAAEAAPKDPCDSKKSCVACIDSK